MKTSNLKEIVKVNRFKRVRNFQRSNRIKKRIFHYRKFTDSIIQPLLRKKITKTFKFHLKELKVISVRDDNQGNVVVFGVPEDTKKFFKDNSLAFEILQTSLNEKTGLKNKIVFSMMEPVKVQNFVYRPSSSGGWDFVFVELFETFKRRKFVGKYRRLKEEFLEKSFSHFILSKFNEELKDSLEWIFEEDNSEFDSPIFITAENGLGKTSFVKNLKKCFEEQGFRVASFEGINFIEESGFLKSDKSEWRIDFPTTILENFDIFIFDDIQLINNQELELGLARTIDLFVENKKRVIITSNAFPENLKGLNKHFSSRIKESIFLDIKYLDSESFEKIFAYLESLSNVKFVEEDREEILHFFKRFFSDSIRSLKGAFLTLRGRRFQQPKVYEFQEIKEKFEHRFKLRNDPVARSKLVAEEVANFFGLKKRDLHKKRKRIKVQILAKHITFYMMKKVLHQKLSSISTFFNESSHSSISTAIHKISRRRDENVNLREDISMILKRLDKKGLRIDWSFWNK